MKNLTITEVSHVTTIAGVAKFRTPDGVLHELQVGDILQPGMEILLGDASNFAFEKGLPEAIQASDIPADQQPTMPAMGAANGDQTTAQINELQQAILSGQDPTQAFEAAAAGIAADAGGAGPGSGNDGFISITRVGDATIAESGYDTTAPTADQLLQINTPAAPTVTAVNSPTVVAPDTNTIAEDTVATGNVLANDSDVDDVLTVASFVVGGVAYSAGNTATLNGIGTIIINSDGSYVFTPVENWNGAIPEVTYTMNTGSSSTLNIEVTPVNDPPVSTDDSVTTAEDVTIPLHMSDFGAYSDATDGSEATAFAGVKITSLENNGSLQYFNGTTWTDVTLNQEISAADLAANNLRFVPDHRQDLKR
nr:retention module-containing protein [uncultured Tolumonas sp.]